MSSIQNAVKTGITPIVVFLVVMIIAAMTAAASIEETLKVGVISASGFIEVYLVLYMLDRI